MIKILINIEDEGDTTKVNVSTRSIGEVTQHEYLLNNFVHNKLRSLQDTFESAERSNDEKWKR